MTAQRAGGDWARVRRALVHAAPVCGLALVVAHAAAAHGSFPERLAAATQRIAAAPKEASLYLERAELYRDHGDPARALADLDRAAALDARLPELDYLRGLTLLDAGRPAEAAEALRRCLAASPEHAEAHASLATALGQLGRTDEADAEYARAIASLPRPLPDLYFERARLLAEAGDQRLDQAIASLDAGLARLGPVASLELYAVDLELRRGNVDAALARLDRVAATSRRREGWLAQRGRILEDAGRVGEARAAYAQALEELATLPSARRATPAARSLETQLRESLKRVSQ